jgi:DNA-directed RNA polymerase subunit RPC12/RpoP
MASISSPEKCPRCGSTLVGLEWDECVNDREIQDLWHCWNCNNEFITIVASNENQPPATRCTRSI